MKEQVKNPFPVTGYHGSAYFCDREHELTSLQEAISSNRNMTLIALRRMGKTALIQHLFQSLDNRQYQMIYADLMPTTNLRDLHTELLTALARAFPEKSSLGKQLWKWIKSIRPTVTYDPYTSLPTVSVALAQPEEHLVTIGEMLSMIDGMGHRVVVALDEFQQITQYPEKQTEAWLRAQIQRLKNTTFIFSGSQQTILQEMFLSAKRPFYASTQLLTLSYIDKATYAKFIAAQFAVGKRKITESEINTILEWCRVHTYYVQTLCNRLYGQGNQNIIADHVRSTMRQILSEQEGLFYTYREIMTGPQWNLLKSIAKEDKLYAPTASGFIRKYRLGGAATIKRSLTALLDNEMIFQAADAAGKRYYQVYDVFLSRWLETMP